MTLEQLVTDKYLKQIPVAGLTPGDSLASANASGTAWTMPVGGGPAATPG